MQDLARHISTTLQLLRKQRGWSLDKAAMATGVSKAMLGQIERGESSPTVATLWKIATGFETSFSAFLEPSPVSNIWRQDAAQFATQLSQSRQENDRDIIAKAIIPYDQKLGFELLQVTIPGGLEYLSSAHAAGVIEHVIPLNGALEVMADGIWQSLETGDAIRFDASIPHGYRNHSEHSVNFHNLICYTTSLA